MTERLSINCPSVVIFHPERQHAHQLAIALRDAQLLERFYYGGTLPTYVRGLLPTSLTKRVHWYQPARRVISYALSGARRTQFANALLEAYDRWAARTLSTCNASAVVAYEGTARLTFTAAKRFGIKCILDAANVHFSEQIKWLPDSNTTDLVRRKQQEIDLADLILTCSSYARDTYLAAGVSASRVVSLPLGVEIPRSPVREKNSTGPLRLCYAGHISRRKGIDTLISALQALKQRNVLFKLHIAGNPMVAENELLRPLESLGALAKQLNHEQMADFYGESDVLVLPSRFDSFGMVVSEALSCGLPVVVSENVGARDLVVPGKNGWVVPPGNADKLAEILEWCCTNADTVRGMQHFARDSILDRGWPSYRHEAARTIEQYLSR